MTRQRLSRFSFAATLVTLAFLGACTDYDVPTASDPFEGPAFSQAPPLSQGEALKVMTRNMYLGGDVNPLFLAAANPDPNQGPGPIIAAAQTVWTQIQATNFPERAQALAREIAENQPHIVGIQEIPLFEMMDPANGQWFTAQDNVDILMTALAGEPYTALRVQENTQATFPLMVDGSLLYIRFTDRIAVLVRDDLEVESVASACYGAGMPLIQGQLELKRGWIRVSAQFNGLPYHIVTTHLEVQGFYPIQAAQVDELLGEVLAGLDGVTILMGDLNSDAENGPGAPSYTPTYEDLLAAGFQDAWEMANPSVRTIGFSCCQEPTLDNSGSELDERIDFILLRSGDRNGGNQRIPGSIHVDMVGEDRADWTPSGLWPSDHAGLVATLKPATGIFRNP